jgi:hypothetical protein
MRAGPAARSRAASRTFQLSGGRKNCKILTGPIIEAVETNLPVTGCRELAAQEIGRHPVPRNRSVEIDNTERCAGLEGRCQIVQECIGLGDLVIRMHDDRSIEETNR